MNVLICDDSGMARKQMARALPVQWVDSVTFAEHGQAALEILESHSIDLMFLDLTMPVMDGYETLAVIKSRQIKCMVIVVSGDIQPEAQARAISLGALAFQQKPVLPADLHTLLIRYGLLSAVPDEPESQRATGQQVKQAVESFDVQTPEECLQEVSNVAMGQAADKLARLLGVFINLPIPKVATFTRGELAMTLESLTEGQHKAVCQGFVARGLAAEAVLSTDLKGIEGLEQLMVDMDAHKGDKGSGPVLDAAAVLIGAFLNGIGRILDMTFSKGQPVLLSAETVAHTDWQQQMDAVEDTLAIEIPYHFEEQDFVCDLLLLFPGKAAQYMLERVSFLIDGEDA